MRIDQFMNFVMDLPRCKSEAVKPHLLRTDIYSLIEQQENILWKNYSKCNLMVMDSFCELTDQMFKHKREGWTFCAHYSDINHSKEFEDSFECLGLLPLGEIEQSYKEFFEYLFSNFPRLNVVFINFPAALDNRSIFKRRSETISKAILGLNIIFPKIKYLYIDEKDIMPAETDNYPYHFSKFTQQLYLRKYMELVSQM